MHQCNLFLSLFILLARAIDSSWGGLNLNGVEHLREFVEELERYERGCIPSRSTIQDRQRKLESYMSSTYMPYTCKYDDILKCEIASFKPQDVLKFILKTFQLDERAKSHSVELAITEDGARLTNKYGHVSVGFKVVDKSARDPITKEFITDFQSVYLCFPVKTYLGPEKKS